MAKIEDPAIRVKDRALQEWISELAIFWNRGKYSFGVISADPTDTPQDIEIRVYDSGAGVVRLYVFVPGSEQSGSGWWRTGDLTEVT